MVALILWPCVRGFGAVRNFKVSPMFVSEVFSRSSGFPLETDTATKLIETLSPRLLTGQFVLYIDRFGIVKIF